MMGTYDIWTDRFLTKDVNTKVNKNIVNKHLLLYTLRSTDFLLFGFCSLPTNETDIAKARFSQFSLEPQKHARFLLSPQISFKKS